MAKLLKDIASIQAGHPFRERIEPVENGGYQVIQIKDIGNDENLLADDLLKIDVEVTRKDYYVQPNDVLFTTRGLNRRACFVGEEFQNTVFVAQIFALRVFSEDVEPSYLAWYLNQKQAQEYFEATASGSYIQNIRKDVLADLPVIVPPISTQRKIVEVQKLALREKNLIERIKSKRELLIEKILFDAINKEK